MCRLLNVTVSTSGHAQGVRMVPYLTSNKLQPMLRICFDQQSNAPKLHLSSAPERSKSVKGVKQIQRAVLKESGKYCTRLVVLKRELPD